MPPDKDDKDDTITDNTDTDSCKANKPCIKYKTNKVSDINRQQPHFNNEIHEPAVLTTVNENHVENVNVKQKKPKKQIKFSNDVKVKDSPNHSYILDKICDDKAGYTIEDVDDTSKSNMDIVDPDGVSAVVLIYISILFTVL